MSNYGLYASIYEELRAYADKLDCALVNLRSNDTEVVTKASKELVDLLRQLGTSDTVQPDRKLIAVVLAQELKSGIDELYNFFLSLADSLEAGKTGKEELSSLERIAVAIDKECVSTGRRMRGRL